MDSARRPLERTFAIAIASLIALAVATITVTGYGWVPHIGDRHTEVYFGSKPGSWVAWYGSGFTDHQIYFIFRADKNWVEQAASFAGLVNAGEMQRADCLTDASYAPWWFNLSPRSQGDCWKGSVKHGGRMTMNYLPSSGLIYDFDFSS